MKKKWHLLLLLILTGISLLACSASSLISSNNGSEQSKVLFSDDFSKTNTGWDEYEDSEMVTKYENGMYVVANNLAQYFTYAYANKNLTDTSIEVESTLLSGPMDVESGIICRSNGDNFYYGMINIEGYYVIGKVVGEDFSYVQMESMLYNSAINIGNETNTIRFDCIGDSLSLYVNGQLLTSVNDSELTSGDIGFLVGTYDEAGAKFGFDNLVVTKP